MSDNMDDISKPSGEEPKTDSKHSYRSKMWREMDQKNLVIFPRPCRGRIPNFLNSMAAAEKLGSEEVFKKAEVILVNLDTAQEGVRFVTLEEGKTLLVPNAQQDNGIMMKICPPADATRDILKAASKRLGFEKYGQAISTEDNIHIDMVVMGSVAVSKDGHRIGKGGGFSDLEYAIMSVIGAVTENTVLVTTVHDDQVYDTLPNNLFDVFDVPVDVIVTPTQTIEVRPRLPRPEGVILWNLLTNRRLEQIPLLKTLRNKEMESGNDCVIQEGETVTEYRPRPFYRRTYPPFYKRKQRFHDQRENSQSETQMDSSRHSRTFRRRPQTNGDDAPAKEPYDQRERDNRNYSRADRKTDEGRIENRRKRLSRNRNSTSDAATVSMCVDDENRENQQQKPFRRQNRQFIRNGNVRDENKESHQQRPFRRQNRRPQRSSDVDDENKENQQQRPFRKQSRRRFPRTTIPVDFSVKVSNIDSTMRVRDLKAALIEKGVRPRTITWRGQKGFAFLHFAKLETEPEQPTAVDDVIASLQGLTVKSEYEAEVIESLLAVEPAKPISRIEDAGATAV